jgi:Pectate lyase superfamily protein
MPIVGILKNKQQKYRSLSAQRKWQTRAPIKDVPTKNINKTKTHMPLKTLPQVNDLNWGAPLNAHIGQLQDSTNGGINKFEQFSQRPTTLTADDVGKTYLYTQTGNIHQWTGTAWKVLNESVINVKDYGAIGDGVTDDTAAIQPLLNNSINSNKTLLFPEGTFLINIVMNRYPPNIKGMGKNSTKLSSFTNDGFAISYAFQDTWCPVEIKNLQIIGNLARTKNGIQFGLPVFSNADQFGGGLRLIQVLLTDMDICVLKRYGQIGNYFDSCSFRNSNYHYKATAYKGNTTSEGVLQPGNHSGCDTFHKCEFGGAFKSAVFIDGSTEGVNGQHIFRDCVFQQNTGFCFFVKRYSNSQFTPGLIVENTWFEFNAGENTTGNVPYTVDIEGIPSTPRQFYLNEANIIIEKCFVFEIELIKSNVITKGTASALAGVLPKTNVIKDNYSSITFEEVTSYEDFLYYNRRPIYLNSGAAASRTTITAPRQVISKSSDNLIYSDSFAELETRTFSGLSAGVYGKLVKDGRLFDRCFEMTFDSTNNNQDYIMDPSSEFTLPKDKYYFWSVDVKKVSGDDIEIAYSKDFRLGTFVKIQNKEWTTLVGLGDTFGFPATQVPLTVWPVVFSKNKNVTFRISCFQVLAFDSQQELMEYSDSMQFRTKTDKLISSSSVLPTTGTYNKGDLIYSTNPTPGGYVGWICTASGTPGTWNTFGAIN